MAVEQLSEGELLDPAVRETNVTGLQKTFDAREQWSEGELLSTAAERPREKRVTAGEQPSEGELLDPAARETNMLERETALTRRYEEPLTSTAQKGRQSGAAAEQHRTAVVSALVAVMGALRASQMTKEERKISPAQLYALVEGMPRLAPEGDSEKSDRQDTTDKSPALSLEQMVSRLRHLAATVAPRDELGQRPPAPSEDAQASAEPLRGQAAERPGSEPNHDCHSGEVTTLEAVMGSLRTTQEDKWRCKVPSCTRDFHRLKDCSQFGRMDPRDRMALVERLQLCVACLTPGHNQSARKCPYKEERIDTCEEPACKATRHRLLHIEGGWE
jgi:hypothetical protein